MAAVIAMAEVMPLLCAACPSFVLAEEDVTDEAGALLPYVALGLFADYVVELIAAAKEDEMPAIFSAAERLHVEGDDLVREAATIGLLEGLQNHAEHRDLDKARITRWLGPESARWWRTLDAFWSGRARTVGEGHERGGE